MTTTEDFNTSLILTTNLVALEGKLFNLIDRNIHNLDILLAEKEFLISKKILKLNKDISNKTIESFIDLYLYNKAAFKGLECTFYLNYYFEVCYYELDNLNRLAGNTISDVISETKRRIGIKFMLVLSLVTKCPINYISYTVEQLQSFDRMCNTILEITGFQEQLTPLMEYIKVAYDESAGDHLDIFSCSNTSHFATLQIDELEQVSTLDFHFSWDDRDLSIPSLKSRYNATNTSDEGLQRKNKSMHIYKNLLSFLIKIEAEHLEHEFINQNILLPFKVTFNLLTFLANDLLNLEPIWKIPTTTIEPAQI